jgi:hypothetical protein
MNIKKKDLMFGDRFWSPKAAKTTFLVGIDAFGMLKDSTESSWGIMGRLVAVDLQIGIISPLIHDNMDAEIEVELVFNNHTEKERPIK